MYSQYAARSQFSPTGWPVSDRLGEWRDLYFERVAAASPASRQKQQRALKLFIDFCERTQGSDRRSRWTPALSQSFQNYLASAQMQGQRRWSNRTINGIFSHLRTFARWLEIVTRDPDAPFAPFPEGNPTDRVKSLPLPEAAASRPVLTSGEAKRLLAAADRLLLSGGRSRDRNRYRGKPLPRRKGYRPYRNRAIIHLLVATGLNRQELINLDRDGLDRQAGTVAVRARGGRLRHVQLDPATLSAVHDYVLQERPRDAVQWTGSALFLPARTVANSSGRLTPQVINDVWNAVCRAAGVEGKSPGGARGGHRA